MKKKLFHILIATFIITLVNTGCILFLTYDKMSSYIQNRPVVISKDYDKGQSIQKAISTEKPMIVWFYTDWCRYCQKFAPTFKKVTKNKEIKKAFAVAYVNAEDPKNSEFVKEYKVEGYPTVWLVDKERKEFISPVELFAPNSANNLKEKFLEFLK